MANVTPGAKRRNRAAPLKDEIRVLLKAENKERSKDGLTPMSMETVFNDKGVPLRIEATRRVNLSVTPEIYDKALRVGAEVETLIKLDIDPASSRFWLGLLDIVGDSLEVLKEKRKDADDFKAKHDAIMKAFKFKGVE